MTASKSEPADMIITGWPPVWAGVWPLLAINLALLFLQIGHQSLWLDEMTSLAVASGPVEQALAFFRQHREQHPVYYILLKGWLVFGSSEAALRSFSAVAAATTTILLYFAGRRLVGEWTARVVTLLAACSPFLVYYGQEGRMYAMLMAEAVGLTHLFHLWWQRPTRVRALAYWVVGVLTVYTHIAGVFVVAAHAAWALMARERWERRGAALLICGAVGVSYLPWLGFLLGHPSPEQDWKSWLHAAFGLPYTLLRWSLGYSVVLANAGWKERVPDLVWENAPVLAAAVVGYGFLFLTGFARLQARLRDPAGLVILLLLVPVLMAAVASPVAILLSERYLSVSFPAYLLIVAAGIEQVVRGATRRMTVQIVAPILVAGSVGVALWRYYTDSAYGKAEWRAVARLVEHSARPDDAILLHSSAIEPVFRYYAKRLPAVWTTSDPAVLDSVDTANRVWVVISHAMDGGDPVLRALAPGRVADLDTVFPKEVGIRVVRFARHNSTGDARSTVPAPAGESRLGGSGFDQSFGLSVLMLTPSAFVERPRRRERGRHRGGRTPMTRRPRVLDRPEPKGM
jgi:4-amino-4-deoxy-L-arabinose transferase-like glycosyltransferase